MDTNYDPSIAYTKIVDEIHLFWLEGIHNVRLLKKEVYSIHMNGGLKYN
jgi:hypothetical protein